ncbi:eukaryotic translation initiation factor 5-like [Lineus longissimus]|uniref:eukaryotic translation initiation factor 5-like n=1 Tax=Lineus longissimus TaxID=88925 RepID=UPI002B4DC899
MAVNVNINKADDQFYRYKMPKLIAKVEGKGNGIKTVIVNMPEIAKALSRPPTYPTKYFGCELGAQTQFDLKNDRYIVNGSHDPAKLEELLHNFIKKFVLCQQCENPETDLVVLIKKQKINQRCIACGYVGMVDMTHKLTTFILKNPADGPAATPSKKDKKAAKRKEKENEKKGRSSPEGNHNNTTNGDAASPKEAVRETTPSKEKTPAKDKNHVNKAKLKDDDEDDDDWGEDFNEEEIKARMEELSHAAKALTMDDDLEKSSSERLDIFYKFVKNKLMKNEIVGHDKSILAEADRLEVRDRAPLVLVELLLTEDVLNDLKKYWVVFLRFCHENIKAQRYLLGGFELLVGKVHRDTLLPKVPHIIKSLYDLEILEEEVILEWGEKPTKKYVEKSVSEEIHKNAEPMLKWLAEAEEEEASDEEDEDEDDEDGDVQVVYKKDATKVHTKTIKAEPVKPAARPAQEVEEEDFDIDAI